MRRRDFARMIGLGAAGTLLSPFVAQLVREAQGQESDIRRLVLFTNGCGFIEPNYSCNARSETDFDLSPTYDPLAPYKDDLNILSKFYNPFDRALHGNQWATLSVRPGGVGDELRDLPPGAGGVSIDRFIAQTIGVDDPFSSTAVGVEEAPGKVLCLSVDGPGTPFPALGSPVRAYSTWFGETMGVDEGEVRRRLAAEQSLLDGVTADVGAMRRRLAGPERARMDQYLESLRALEGQLSAVPTCDPASPEGDLDRADLDPRVVRAHVDATFEVQRCGLTRVSHISILGMEGPHNPYSWLGDTRGHHECFHQNEMGMVRNIDHFVLGEIAHYWQRLKETPEAGGTMADRTLVVYVNCCGGEHHNGQDKHAVLMLGGLEGHFRTGRYLGYEQGAHCISDVYVSIANAMGVDIDSFGAPEVCRGPLPGLT